MSADVQIRTSTALSSVRSRGHGELVKSPPLNVPGSDKCGGTSVGECHLTGVGCRAVVALSARWRPWLRAGTCATKNKSHCILCPRSALRLAALHLVRILPHRGPRTLYPDKWCAPPQHTHANTPKPVSKWSGARIGWMNRSPSLRTVAGESDACPCPHGWSRFRDN